ncbi:MAG: YafY family transcriptional regulator [Chitinophagaceae bacterium]|nr:YafY family transcriptional regulator [Chitinophagaceae bacterium]MCW5927971.1 YafY family transcriptional regulator [Chitinophagaceae bacterium]
MIDESPKRFDRIVAILIQLQSKRIIKAQELADRFDVSLRTIYRDIKALEASGVPIGGEAGVGYSIMEGYRLPPVMFSKEEATSFVAAEKLMQHLTDKSLGGHFQSAMYKIKSVLRWSEKERVDTLDTQVMVKPAHPLFRENVLNALELLMNGMANKQQVFIRYQSLEAAAPVDRYIEPVGLYHENLYWYLLAYCHLRKEHRKFRTDRIFSIAASDKPFELQHRELSHYLKEETDHKKTEIRICVDKSTARYIRNSRKFYGFISEEEKEGEIEMLFRYYEDMEFFARWYLMFGDYARILAPESLREKVKAILQRSLEKLVV